MANWKRDEDDERQGTIHHTGRSHCDSGFYYITYEDGEDSGLAFDYRKDAEDYLNHK